MRHNYDDARKKKLPIRLCIPFSGGQVLVVKSVDLDTHCLIWFGTDSNVNPAQATNYMIYTKQCFWLSHAYVKYLVVYYVVYTLLVVNKLIDTIGERSSEREKERTVTRRILSRLFQENNLLISLPNKSANDVEFSIDWIEFRSDKPIVGILISEDKRKYQHSQLLFASFCAQHKTSTFQIYLLNYSAVWGFKWMRFHQFRSHSHSFHIFLFVYTNEFCMHFHPHGRSTIWFEAKSNCSMFSCCVHKYWRPICIRRKSLSIYEVYTHNYTLELVATGVGVLEPWRVMKVK